jgi:hypothetical protein
MSDKVKIKYRAKNKRLVISMTDAEDGLAVCVCNVRDMITLQGWDGYAWQLRGYSICLNRILPAGSYTLDSLGLPPDMYEELNVFFTLFCEVEEWRTLTFEAEEWTGDWD